jgi:hypothetical protein
MILEIRKKTAPRNTTEYHQLKTRPSANTVNIVHKLVTVFAVTQPLKNYIVTIYRDTSVAQLCIS